MRRTHVVAALGAIALGTSFADAQELPALEPPLEAPPDASSPSDPPAPPTVERPRPADPPASRPYLVIPGVTAPTSRRTTTSKPAAENVTSLPDLDEPVVPPDVHLRLAPIPDARASETSSPGPRIESTPRREAAPPRGPSSPFDREAGPTATARDRADRSAEPPDDDPAVEAAVKRRVEKLAAEALGNRLADLKVRVRGHDITIQALMTRFWYRWWARRALQSLAMPAGYRSRVLVD